MKFIETKISDLIIIEPTVFGDSRGYFLESYNQKKFEEVVGITSFVQDNESKSSKGVIRGLHFQKPPYDHNKFVYCISGSVIDYFLDIRLYSKTYGKVCSVQLGTDDNTYDAVYLPKGIAHGFLSEIDNSTLVYKTDTKYNSQSDDGINWRSFIDIINIDDPIVSDRDNSFVEFSHFNSPFKQK